MSKITHCRVTISKPLEVIVLKTTPDRQNLKLQKVFWYKCPACIQDVYRWQGIRKDGTLTALYRIQSREFEREWLPRFKTDIVRPDRPKNFEIYVSEHTLKIHHSPEQTSQYLLRKGLM